VSGRDLRARILENLPEEITPTGDRGIKLSDVRDSKYALREFVAQLSDKELGDLSRGEGGMRSALGVPGNAGAFGGITEELREKGIPAIITADGPAGLRVSRYVSLLPCGTSLACTWNSSLVEALLALEGREALNCGVDVILAPGMNIHRNPLCGRNFEYYSEDPVLSGRIAAAAVRGIQSSGVSACPKHFAANNQEVRRNTNDSRVSEQALREIYLRNFEICVKEGKPQNIMTSYNKINGVWSHYNYDLVTTVLRNDWGYTGNVMTDWWMQKAKSPEFPSICDNAYRVRAQVDVAMPGGMTSKKQYYIFDKEQLETLGKPDGLTRGELQRGAMNVLRFALTRLQ
jgi:beta-glucosidase